MSAYQIVTPAFVGFNGAGGAASATASTSVVPVGFAADGYDASLGVGRFVYAQGSDASARGQFVQIINGSAVLLAAGNSASANQVGVLAAGWTTSGTAQYGWVQVGGYVDYAKGTNSSIAAGVPLYICAATAGLVLTNAVAGNRVQGLVAAASYTSSQSNSLSVVLNGACFVNGATAVL